MDLKCLEFERPIAELEAKILELRRVDAGTEVSLSDELARLEARSQELMRSIFSKMTPMQIVQMARHPLRPNAYDYILRIFTEFDELSGDRHASKGCVIIGGLARLEGRPVMVLGQQKGRTTKEKVARNFGMPKPEDYRKARRLMQMAARFKLPVITFIDTPGAYPGIDAEEHNQSEAIARNLFVMSRLKTPILCVIIGEGGSGGALAIGVGDRVLMLQYSIYSVISPEGAASILWKSVDKVADAASAMALTASALRKRKLVTEVIEEPLGGAHRDVDKMAKTLKQRLCTHLAALQDVSIDTLCDMRYAQLMAHDGT